MAIEIPIGYTVNMASLAAAQAQVAKAMAGFAAQMSGTGGQSGVAFTGGFQKAVDGGQTGAPGFARRFQNEVTPPLIEGTDSMWKQAFSPARMLGIASSIGLYYAASQIGRGVIAAITAPITEADELRTSLRALGTLFPDAAKNGDEFTSMLLTMDKRLGSTAELSEAYFTIIQAGLRDTAEAQKVLQASAELAASGFVDQNTAAEAVTSVMLAYGEAGGTAAQVSEKIFRGFLLARTGFKEFVNSIGPVLPMARALNIPFDDLAQTFILLTRHGFPAARAMTAIRMTMTKTIDTTDEARKNFEKLFGITPTITNMRAEIERLGGFPKFLIEVAHRSKEAGIEIDGLFTRLRSMLLPLDVAADGGEQMVKTILEWDEAAGKLSETVDKATDTLLGQNGQVDTFKRHLEDMFAIIGSGANEKLLNWFSAVNSQLTVAKSGLQGMIAELGNLFSFIGRFDPSQIWKGGGRDFGIVGKAADFVMPSALEFGAAAATSLVRMPGAEHFMSVYVRQAQEAAKHTAKLDAKIKQLKGTMRGLDWSKPIDDSELFGEATIDSTEAMTAFLAVLKESNEVKAAESALTRAREAAVEFASAVDKKLTEALVRYGLDVANAREETLAWQLVWEAVERRGLTPGSAAVQKISADFLKWVKAMNAAGRTIDGKLLVSLNGLKKELKSFEWGDWGAEIGDSPVLDFLDPETMKPTTEELDKWAEHLAAVDREREKLADAEMVGLLDPKLSIKLNTVSESIASVAESFKPLLGVLGLSESKIAGVLDVLADLPGQVSGIQSSFGSMKEGFSVGGVAGIVQGIAGAASVVGGVISIGSAAVGVFKELFGGPSKGDMNAQAEIAARMGVAIDDVSMGLTKQVRSLRANGQEWRTLGAILQEVEVSSENVVYVGTELNKIFEGVENGSIDAAAGARELANNVEAIGPHLLELREQAPEAFRELVANMQETGIVSAEAGQVFAQLTQEYLPALGQALDQNLDAASFAFFADTAIASFTTLLQGGVPLTEALGLMGDHLDRLAATAGQFEAVPGLGLLTGLRAYSKEHPEIMERLTALHQGMTFLSDVGRVNTENFTAWQQSLVNTSTMMLESGASAEQMYLLMSPNLGLARELADVYGLQLSPGVQQLIDDGLAMGQTFENQKPVMTQVRDLMQEMVDVLKIMAGVADDAGSRYGRFADQVNTSAAAFVNLNKSSNFQIPIPSSVGGETGTVGGGTASSGGNVNIQVVTTDGKVLTNENIATETASGLIKIDAAAYS